jgi:short-subunit dehydrogenase
MKSNNGGKIIVLSSTAAFPVLKSNFLYGLAKLGLDMYSRYLQSSFVQSQVDITIVRSGFVATKLNQGRRPTPFSRSSAEVAELIVKNLDKSIIWTPPIFRTISYLLTKSKFLRKFANSLVEKSKV